MIDRDFGRRLTEHQTRVAHINREAWKWQVPPTVKASRTRRTLTAGAWIRERVGLAVVRAGERLQGASAGRVADPTAAG